MHILEHHLWDSFGQLKLQLRARVDYVFFLQNGANTVDCRGRSLVVREAAFPIVFFMSTETYLERARGAYSRMVYEYVAALRTVKRE